MTRSRDALIELIPGLSSDLPTARERYLEEAGNLLRMAQQRLVVADARTVTGMLDAVVGSLDCLPRVGPPRAREGETDRHVQAVGRAAQRRGVHIEPIPGLSSDPASDRERYLEEAGSLLRLAQYRLLAAETIEAATMLDAVMDTLDDVPPPLRQKLGWQ